MNLWLLNNASESDWALREHTNDAHLDILLLQVGIKQDWNPEHGDEREQDDGQVPCFAASFPGGDLCRIGLRVVVICSAVEPM